MSLLKNRIKLSVLCPGQAVKPKSLPKGFSLVELMIASSIALILLALVLNIYLSHVKNSRKLLNASSINQEIDILTHIIVKDLRQAGFWQSSMASQQVWNQPARIDGNWFMPYAIRINQSQDCIAFALDQNKHEDGQIRAEDLIAFRLKNKALQVLKFANIGNFVQSPCSNKAGRWMSLTDKNLVLVTDLHFDTQGSVCYQLDKHQQTIIDKDSYLFPCIREINRNSDETRHKQRMLEQRVVNMRIQLQLKNQPSISALREETVKIANNILVMKP